MLRLHALGRSVPVRTLTLHRFASTVPPVSEPASTRAETPEATPSLDDAPAREQFYLYYNLVFPLRTSLLDLRYLVTQFQRPQLVESLRSQLAPIPDRYPSLHVEEINTREKDGGAFVRFSYDPTVTAAPTSDQLERLVAHDAGTQLAHSTSPKPWFHAWAIWSRQVPRTFLVRGRPWMEDMNRFPSRELVVEFEGPEIPQERLYDLFRPYGKIHDIVPTSPKAASIVFTHLRAATSARNCLHSSLVEPSSPNVTTPTVLRILYKPKRHFAYFRDWITSHPKIVLPLFVALLGTVSYAVFDPVRELFVQAKIAGTFDADKYRAVRWLKKETLGRLGLRSNAADEAYGAATSGIEKERQDAKEDLKAWLKGNPESFITVQGPRGSGKTALIDQVLVDGKNILTIDCTKISKAARSDTKLVSELASAVGYYPQFVLASSLNNMIDLAAVGLIGQKAGFSSNLDTQLKAILEVTASALAKLSNSIRARSLAATASTASARQHVDLERSIVRQLENDGSIRDGRIDTVAGNGAISELGAGVEIPVVAAIEGQAESIKEEKLEIVGPRSSELVREASKTLRDGKTHTAENGQEIREREREMERLPVVVIKGFAAKGEAKQEVLWDVLSEWAAVLVENQIAHVIFTSDSPTLSKPLAKALPSKPFNSINLTDASPEASLAYVAGKLDPKLLPPTTHASVARLGGRQTDLELLIEKVRAGQQVEEATDDIVYRSATEIRKNFFGDDEEEAKGLKWKREQAGAIMQGLCKHGELKYAETLIKTFGGDEMALRALENAEMISITHRDGRPSIIKPGRPVYRSAFAHLLSDPIFLSTLEYRTVVASLASASNDLKASQAELLELSKLFVPDTGKWSLGGGSRTPKEVEKRVAKTLAKMRTSEDKVEKLALEKDRLLKIFAENE
ncbi:Yme2p [Sporobolomyces koalae]|uniref:Yme2p n=1 Tax=Sporobolomyces koalae TaxID=500713 RepID=UPI0031819CDB